MDDDDDRFAPLDLRSLEALSVLGRGAKGIAFLVRNLSSNETLALKTLSLSNIKKKKPQDGYRRILFERDVLKELHHPLLPRLRGFLVTGKIVGFAIQHCSGGDLNALRKKQTDNMFSDDIIRFYAAELVLALEYLHGLGIIYRDLKPENVLIQENGHLMLIDFDLSKKLTAKPPEDPQRENRSEKPVSAKKKRFPAFSLCKAGFAVGNPISPAENSVDSSKSDSLNSSQSNSFVGTQDYVAPEVISGNGHDFAVDWWSLGVLLYEMLYGETPFRGVDRKETFYRILTKTPELVGEESPLRDLIRRLLEKDSEKRISAEDIKGHGFFGGVDWESVLKISRPPFIPEGRAEEMDGNMGIDVEEFVEKVFNDSDLGKEKSLEKKKTGVWVDALCSNTASTGDFSGYF